MQSMLIFRGIYVAVFGNITKWMGFMVTLINTLWPTGKNRKSSKLPLVQQQEGGTVHCCLADVLLLELVDMTSGTFKPADTKSETLGN